MSNPPPFNCLMASSAAECWLKTATTEFWSWLGVLFIVRLLILGSYFRTYLCHTICIAISRGPHLCVDEQSRHLGTGSGDGVSGGERLNFGPTTLEQLSHHAVS